MDWDAAWDAVHEARPACWQVGPTIYSSSSTWLVGATDRIRDAAGARRPPTPAKARTRSLPSWTLDEQLRGVGRLDESRMDEPWARARLAFVTGAEDWSRTERDGGLAGKRAGTARAGPSP